MRFIRTILLMLLALNLPGWAFAAMPACSMQHSPLQHAPLHHERSAAGAQAHAAVMDAAIADMAIADTAHAAHCCTDGQSLDDRSAPGTACQDGAHCQCGTLYQSAQPLVTAIVPAAPGIDQTSLFHVITASALPHWRPPTSA
jgi:hypothetical protein